MDPHNLSTHSFVSKLMTIVRLDGRGGGGEGTGSTSPPQISQNPILKS